MIYMCVESVIYSPVSGQCLTEGMKRMDTPLPGIISVVLATLFEILLLALTIVKVCKSTESIDSLPSSPIVRVVFHFHLSSKLISVCMCQMQVVVRDEILYVE